MTGRRIYVHALTFKDLCRESPDACMQVFECLLAVTAKKMLYNRVVQDGYGVLYHDAAVREVLRKMIAALELQPATATLRQIDLMTGEREDIDLCPLLGVDEVIEASCFDDNYYTFATSSAAAEAMYADHEPIKQLRARLAASPRDSDICDLTLVRGRRLCWRSEDRTGGDRLPAASPKVSDLNLLAVAAVQKGNTAVTAMFARIAETIGRHARLDTVATEMLEALPGAIDPVLKA